MSVLGDAAREERWALVDARWLQAEGGCFSFSTLRSFNCVLTPRCKPSRREDAGFSRMPSWRRGCMVLLQFQLDRFSFQDCFVGVRVVGRPAFELSVLFKQELECFADDVGRIRIKELCIPVEVIPDFFFQSDL